MCSRSTSMRTVPSRPVVKSAARSSRSRSGCRSRRTDQPARLVVGADVVHGDARVAQLGTEGEPLERVDERGVAAPVGGQRLLGRGGRGRLQVGDHVAAAEGVDRLLRVADQHQRRVAAERPVEHVPLDRVGVLELVDEHDLPAPTHPLARRCVLLAQRVGEAAEQVVVGQHAAAVLATLHLGAHVARERHLRLRDRTGLGVVGCELGLRVADRGTRELQRDRALERWRLGCRTPALEEEVVGHLDDEVVEALHELGARVGVAGDAEGAQHQLAELVGGRDGGAVEAGQRVDDPLAAHARRPH